MLKIAVITPSVNTEYLIRAIKSVQNQTLECKHYVVNDGKDDFSWVGRALSICQKTREGQTELFGTVIVSTLAYHLCSMLTM